MAELKEKYIRDEHARMAYATEKGQKEGFDKGYNNVMQQGLQDGLQQGIDQGRSEEKLQTAQNMLELGLDVDIISKSTGLTIEKILELK